MLDLKTKQLQVFEIVLNAILVIDQFKETRVSEPLDRAYDQLQHAIQLDPTYLLAPYYMAMIDDLIGRSDAAVNRLAQLVTSLPRNDPQLMLEMRLNEATARYHQFTVTGDTAQAILLDDLLTSMRNHRGRRYRRIRQQALALQAQLCATRMIPNVPWHAFRPEDHRQIREYHERVRQLAFDATLRRWAFPLNLLFPAPTPTVAARARNALARAEMYLTDYFCGAPEKLERLRWARDQLSRDHDRSRDDPWNEYDQASCLMRLGIWGHDQHDFDNASAILTEAISRSWPGYGFALFTLGKIFRVRGRMGDAIENLNRAKEIPANQRAISVDRIDQEIRLAEVGDTSYP